MLKSKFLKTISLMLSFMMLFCCFASANTAVAEITEVSGTETGSDIAASEDVAVGGTASSDVIVGEDSTSTGSTSSEIASSGSSSSSGTTSSGTSTGGSSSSSGSASGEDGSASGDAVSGGTTSGSEVSDGSSSSGSTDITIEEVYVETTYQLLKAIGSNKKIILADGIYTTFDTIFIQGVQNLTIEAENAGHAEILSYDCTNPVVWATTCENISFNGIIFGHRYVGYDYSVCGDSSYSQAYVMYIWNSDNVTIDCCDLYGCGTVGIYTGLTTELTVKNSVIRDCSERFLTVSNWNECEFTFENCIISGNGYGISNPIMNADYYESAIHIDNSACYVNFTGCRFWYNQNPSFTTGSGTVNTDNCEFLYNAWDYDSVKSDFGKCLNDITWQIDEGVLKIGYDITLDDGTVIESAKGKVLPYSYSSLPWTKQTYNAIDVAEGVEYDGVIWCTCGDNAMWTLDNGKLTISGYGELYDMEYTVPTGNGYITYYSPWQKYEDKITDIEISDDLKGLQANAFTDTTYVAELRNQSDEIYIGKHFIEFSSINSTCTIKEGTKSIADGAFKYEGDLTKVIIPEGITTLGNYYTEDTHAFYSCNYLEEITFPSTLQTIRPNAFVNCDSLKTIYFNGTKEQWDELYIDETNKVLFDANVYGSDFKIEPLPFTYEINNNEVTVTGVRDGVSELVIPETVEGYPVTSLQQSAFRYNYVLKSIEIQAPITTLNGGFWDCRYLETIILPDTLTELSYSDFGNTAFYNNEDNWKNGILYVGKFLVKAKEDIKGDVTIQDGIKVICDYAFENCEYITNLSIPESVETIGICALEGCISLEELVIPDNATVMRETDRLLFGSLEALKNITLPKTYTAYDFDFQGCYNLENINVRDTHEVFKSVDGVLYTKDLKTLIVYPQGRIASSYTVADGTEVLKESAIMNMQLETLTLPSSITTLEDWSICECNMLKKIIYNGTEEQWNAITKSEDFHYYIEFVSIYGKDFEIVVNPVQYELNGDETAYALVGVAPYVTEVEIPAVYNNLPVTEIYAYAFGSAVNLEKITVESTSEYFCAVDNVLFTKDMKTLIKYAPAKADEEYTIPEGVTDFESGAFEFAPLKKLTLPESMTVIPANAFAYMYDIKEIVLPKTLKEIGYYAFDSCYALERINLPEGLQKIDNGAFSWCNSLEKISIPNSVTELGDYVFMSCKSLKTAEIGTGLTTIPYATFQNCKALVRVTFGTNITSIESYAFYDCSALKYVYYVGGTEEMFWNELEKNSSNNYPLNYATVYYVSEFPEGAEINRITIEGYVSESGTVSNPYIMVDATYCEDANLLVIGYDKNNKIVDKKLAYLGGTPMEGEFSSFKVIAIESFETMRPLCKSKTQKPQIYN